MAKRKIPEPARNFTLLQARIFDLQRQAGPQTDRFESLELLRSNQLPAAVQTREGARRLGRRLDQMEKIIRSDGHAVANGNGAGPADGGIPAPRVKARPYARLTLSQIADRAIELKKTAPHNHRLVCDEIIRDIGLWRAQNAQEKDDNAARRFATVKRAQLGRLSD